MAVLRFVCVLLSYVAASTVLALKIENLKCKLKSNIEISYELFQQFFTYNVNFTAEKKYYKKRKSKMNNIYQ